MVGLDVENLTNRRADNRWDRVAVPDLVERLTWSSPDKVALIGQPGAYAEERFASLTYFELDRLANRLANGLIASGAQRSDVAVIVCENSVEAYIFKLGAAKAGVVVAPINPSLAPDVIQNLLERVEPKFAIVDAEFWTHVEPAFTAAAVAPTITIGIGGDAIADTQSFGEFVDAHIDTSEPDVAIHGDDIWEILFTSGTTAMPKGVMISHTSSTFAAYGFALSLTRGLSVESDVVVGTFLPMIYHIGHNIFTLAAFASGGTFVMGRRPDAQQVVAAVAERGITALWAGSPAMIGNVADAAAEGVDISSLTTIVYGWGAVPPATYDALLAVRPGVVVVGIFGQTESISCHRFWPAKFEDLYRDTAPAINYVGVPSPLLASQVVDAEDKPLDEGTPDVPGEAVYRSPVIAAGYYRDLEATRVAFRDGWFHSGDSCVYDANGQRIMVDRFKDIVKSGGENVSSLRVEAVITSHPDVLKTAVIGVPDERWGEAVTALVVPNEGASIDPAEIIAYARERLAGFETPKSVIVTDSFPETVGGKILKYKLRKQFL